MTFKGRKLVPINEAVLVQLRAEEVSQGGIVLASSFDKREKQATTEAYILAKGDAAFKYNWTGREPQIGDLVRVGKYAGDPAEYSDIIEGQMCKIINAADVYGIYDGEGLNVDQ